jgi:CRP-like cAMP-binding protein
MKVRISIQPGSHLTTKMGAFVSDGEAALPVALAELYPSSVSDFNFSVFAGAPPGLVANTLRGLPSREFAAGDTLLGENEPNDRVFLIQSGEVEVWKGEPHQPQSVRVAQLNAGDCFGEMSAINEAPSSANIVAKSPTTVRVMGLADLPTEGGIKEQVTLNLARTLVRRLSAANGDIQEKHRREMKALQLVASSSAFITRMLTVLTLYMFSLPFVAMLIPLIPAENLISFLFIVVFGWVVLNFMYAQPQVRTESWFMTLQNWPRQVARSFVWAIPPILVFTGLKLLIMHARPGVFAFFEPTSALGPGQPMNFPMWVVFAVIYMVLCFAQEFIRCAVQGTLALILTAASAGGPWKAILLSDVVFMAVHLHLGPAFAAHAFLGGLFFGYEFYKERSFLTVAMSHSIVGVFVVFVVGIPR